MTLPRNSEQKCLSDTSCGSTDSTYLTNRTITSLTNLTKVAFVGFVSDTSVRSGLLLASRLAAAPEQLDFALLIVFVSNRYVSNKFLSFLSQARYSSAKWVAADMRHKGAKF